jgi:hypothetical protein
MHDVDEQLVRHAGLDLFLQSLLDECAVHISDLVAKGRDVVPLLLGGIEDADCAAAADLDPAGGRRVREPVGVERRLLEAGVHDVDILRPRTGADGAHDNDR